MTDTAETSENLAAEVRASLDAAVPVIVGEQPAVENKPAHAKNPKPTVGFIVVPCGWDPQDSHGRLHLWNQHPSKKAAQAERSDRDGIGGARRMIVRVEASFTIVDDGGSDG